MNLFIIKTFNNYNSHIIIHIFATKCLEAGMNIKVLSKLLVIQKYN
jgi:site-specific recombinase XerD